jgi:hypothetical protein
MAKPYASEYRLTGLDCAALNDTAFCVGYRNTAGGHTLKFDAWNPAYRTLRIREGEIGKIGIGTELFLWTAAEDDADLPRRLKIVKVKPETNEIMLSDDLTLKKEVMDQIADWVGCVYDGKRMIPAFASGEYCFAPGEYAFASGSALPCVGTRRPCGGDFVRSARRYVVCNRKHDKGHRHRQFRKRIEYGGARHVRPCGRQRDKSHRG